MKELVRQYGVPLGGIPPNGLIGLIVLCLFIGLLLYHRKKRKALIDPQRFPLKKGSRGKEIKHLQQFILHKYGDNYLSDGITGVFDAQTAEAVQKIFNSDRINLNRYIKYKMFHHTKNHGKTDR